VAIPVLVLVVYWPSLHGDFLWDDDYYVHENEAVKSADGLGRIWFSKESPQYYPLTFTTFWAEWQLWDGNTLGYHLVNVVLHSVNALLFWAVLRQLGLPGAWVAAVVFALHPINVESVAWITQRKNTLSGVFFMSAAWMFQRYQRKGGASRWAATVVLFGGALLSKTTTVMLPAMMVVVSWWAGWLWRRRNLLMLAPLLVMSAVMSAVTIWYETERVQAKGEAWSSGLLERTAVAGKIVWFYLYKLFVPCEFVFNYPRWQLDAGAVGSYLPAVAIVLAGAVMLARRTKWDRAMSAGLGVYVVCLFPVLGFFNVYYMRFSFVADHFAYLPSLGVVALTVCGAAHLARRRGAWRLFGIAASAMVLFLAVQTYRYNRAFAGPVALYEDTLSKNPGSWWAHNNLGVQLMKRYEFAEAAEQFHQARCLNPRIQEAYDNERLSLAYEGRYAEAIEAARAGVRNAASNVRITLELARLLAAAPDAEARDGFEAVMWAEVVARTTKYERAEALDVLAMAYAEQGRFGEAVRTARAAVARAEEQGLYDMAEQIRSRLILYQDGQAYHARWIPPDKGAAVGAVQER
jgi:Flp pilus assembly protein TadD